MLLITVSKQQSQTFTCKNIHQRQYQLKLIEQKRLPSHYHKSNILIPDPHFKKLLQTLFS